MSIFEGYGVFSYSVDLSRKKDKFSRIKVNHLFVTLEGQLMESSVLSHFCLQVGGSNLYCCLYLTQEPHTRHLK